SSGGHLILGNVIKKDGEVGEHVDDAWGTGSGDTGAKVRGAIQTGNAKLALDRGEKGDTLGGSMCMDDVRQTRADAGLGGLEVDNSSRCEPGEGHARARSRGSQALRTTLVREMMMPM
ncbi:unnamed protein product, partial [Ilex paraguariensis]